MSIPVEFLKGQDRVKLQKMAGAMMLDIAILLKREGQDRAFDIVTAYFKELDSQLYDAALSDGAMIRGRALLAQLVSTSITNAANVSQDAADKDAVTTVNRMSNQQVIDDLAGWGFHYELAYEKWMR